MDKKGIIIIEEQAPYRISVLTDSGYRPARTGEVVKALYHLYQKGIFGVLRFLTILVMKSIMCFFSLSQQQLVTDTEHTPEEQLKSADWLKLMTGSQVPPQ